MRIRFIVYSIGLCFIGMQSSAQAQNLSVKTLIDTNLMTFGEQVGIHYIIEMDKDVLLQLPMLQGQLIDGVEIVTPPTVDSTKLKDNRLAINIDFLVTVFDTGLFYIPPQAFVYKDGLFVDTAYSTASYLAVAGVQIDEGGDIRDIKETVGAPISPLLLLAIVIFSPFLIGLIGYGIYLLFFKKEEGDDEIRDTVKPIEAYHITALRELDRIKVQKLWQQKQVKEYYTRITHIVRWLVSKRFDIPALEETSDEILKYIKTHKIDEINFHHLENLLNLADLVKFAKGEPDPDENILHLDNAYEFVKTIRDSEVRRAQEINDKPIIEIEKKA